MADNEVHVIADIAYGAWQHYVTTGDEHYLMEIALPLIIETARYWPERAERNELADGSYHYVVSDVTPPNEWHEHVNNSFFTNTMARWNIQKALELLSDVKYAKRAHELMSEPEITDEELSKWRDVADNIKIPYNPEHDLYEESDGFLDLEVPKDIFAVQYEDYEKSQIIKLADTLLALHLLPGIVDTESFRRHYDYYVPLTTHRSSLSPAMHTLFSLEVGYRDKAYDFMMQACSIDAVKRGTETDLGLHAASLGGGWQAVVFGFGGLKVSKDGLELEPDLPDRWRRLRFGITFRGARINFNITSGRIRVMVSSSAPGPVALRVQGREVVVLPGKPADIRTITKKRAHRSKSKKQQ
jgi:kojibiose phosphorylase